MKKEYRIRYAWTYDVDVAIDHSVMTDEKLHEINNFWSGADDRLREAKGDILKAVLTMLALGVFYTTITELAPEDLWRKDSPEGWPPLDGSEGIELLRLDYFELDADEISIEELP